MQTLEKVQIVEYHDDYAKSVAQMWNESGENWGGDKSVTTEQEVIEEEANSIHLDTFLALVDDKVVGYCGLSEYREDVGALYISIINVHPEYQGLKLGKKMLLESIDKTVKYGWPRLDLFTWPGNTKAVPLYKKVGFFWEDRDDTTHLMNFLPQVLQIDWLRPFFEKHDWYETSQRPIEIKPDGIKDGDYTFYEYKWEAGDEFVRIQFERTGRGIRLIETEDLLVEMNLPAFKLLENEEHQATYRVVNKTSKPCQVSISDNSSGIVEQKSAEDVQVTDEWVGKLPVSISMPKNEPNPWKTHPVIGSNIKVNGSTLPFQMGVFPIKMGKLDLRSVTKNWRPNQKGTLYLDMESQIDEDSTWMLNLPNNDVVEWENLEVSTKVKGKGRVSLPLPCRLLKNGFLTEDVQVRVQRSSGEELSFTTKLTLAFPGFGAKFGGETEDKWYGYNGPNYVEIQKRNNLVRIGSVRSKEEPMTFISPKIGKPYSEELSKQEARAVEYIELPEAFVIKTTLESQAFSSVLLNTYYSIYGDGMVEVKHELLNNSTDEKRELFLKQPIIAELGGITLPLREGVMVDRERTIPFFELIREKEISEKWLFLSKPSGETKGLSWSEDALLKKDSWRFGIEYQAETLQPNEKKCFGPIQIGVNVATSWSDWRELVLGEEVKDLKEVSSFALEAEKNRFISTVGEKVNFAFRSKFTPHVSGTLTVQHDEQTYIKETTEDDGVNQIDIQLDYQSPGVKEVSGKFRSKGQKAELQTLQLVKGKREIEVNQEEDRWTVNNGVLSFKASSEYYPGIFSLTYNGNEALHHQYPEPGPKAWWNPWGGGLSYNLRKVSPYSMRKEKTEVKPMTKEDHLGNEWKGLCLKTSITEHEEMKGVTLRQYALTLPEVPVLAIYAEVDQGSNRTFTDEILDLEAFFKPAEKLSSCFTNKKTEGVFHTYYAGVEEYLMKSAPSVTVGSDERDEKIHMIHPTDNEEEGLYLNPEVCLVETSQKWSATSGDVISLNPTILFFDEDEQSHDNHPFHGLSFR
ncbi:GNAT family N-acetyltransferase [Pontibacillus marinus]|uniref:Acetyltransferase n=1 Tax=Pontibacillus marinus BH030004 = DSM 16465 TaxID=1385511 RepID=A0A0A5GGU2_9BACI|nr:GNAT family N-acetyltransferase [Pontibacillus marinus]KGX90428.1 acetyltransferase [Pontibacillus marinus BH030004 = DSM 16465]